MPRFKIINFFFIIIGPKNILFLQKKTQNCQTFPLQTFWLCAGNLVTFQYLEKNEAGYYFEMLSVLIKSSLLDMLRLKVKLSNYIAESLKSIVTDSPL